MKERCERNDKPHPEGETVTHKPEEQRESRKIYNARDLSPPKGYVYIKGLLKPVDNSSPK